MIAKILLAAGAAERMGSAKQLLIHRGQPLIRRIAELLGELDVEGPTFVVLGARAELIRPVLSDLPLTIIHNTEWEGGMPTSIAAAMRQLPAAAAAVLITVVDQVKVRKEVLQSLVERARANPDRIIACHYGTGTVGVPAIFPAAYFARLQRLDGQGGARQLLDEAAATIIAVDFPEGGIDLDRPEDFVKI